MPRAPLLVLPLLLATAASAQDEWSQWRGPGRDGRVPAGEAPAEWTEEVEPVWKRGVGAGHSSPVVAGGLAFTHTRRDAAEVVCAVSLDDGEIAWQAEYPVEIGINPYADDHGRWPRSTPLVAGGRLVTLGASATLSAWDAATGALAWRRELAGGVDTSQLFCGTSVSPLLDAGRVIVHVGDDSGGAMVAYGLEGGDEVWRTELEGPGYASPVRAELGGIPQLVTLTLSRVIGVALDDGALLWSAPFEDEWNENIVTPVVHGEHVIVAGVRAGMQALRPAAPEAEGDEWEVETVWANKRAALYMSSPVLHDDVLLGFSKERRGQLIAVSPADGTLHWTEQDPADNAALLLAGDRLVVLSTEGELTHGAATAEGWVPAASYEVAQTATWAHPVLLPDGFLIKDADSLVRWRFKAPGE